MSRFIPSFLTHFTWVSQLLTMGNGQPCFARIVCLRIGPFKTGNRAGARVRAFDLASEARQMGEMQNSHGAQFAKTTANCFNSFCHFHLTSGRAWVDLNRLWSSAILSNFPRLLPLWKTELPHTYIFVFLRQPSNFAGYKLLFQLSILQALLIGILQNILVKTPK